MILWDNKVLDAGQKVLHKFNSIFFKESLNKY